LWGLLLRYLTNKAIMMAVVTAVLAAGVTAVLATVTGAVHVATVVALW
jgi:hypothetical protein